MNDVFKFYRIFNMFELRIRHNLDQHLSSECIDIERRIVSKVKIFDPVIYFIKKFISMKVIIFHHIFNDFRSEEHTSELQSRFDLVCRLLLEKKNSYVHKHQIHTAKSR